MYKLLPLFLFAFLLACQNESATGEADATAVEEPQPDRIETDELPKIYCACYQEFSDWADQIMMSKEKLTKEMAMEKQEEFNKVFPTINPCIKEVTDKYSVSKEQIVKIRNECPGMVEKMKLVRQKLNESLREGES